MENSGCSVQSARCTVRPAPSGWEYNDVVPMIRLILAALLALALLPANLYAQNPIRWSITRGSDATVVAGKNVDVHVTAQIEDGWHLYATSVPPGGPVATVISVAPGGPFSLGGVIDEPLP